MNTNWKGPIGPVTIKHVRGQIWTFPVLSNALRFAQHHGFALVEHLPESLQTPDGRYLFSLSFAACLFDECGLVIPLWRIAEEAARIGEPPLPSYALWSRGPTAYDAERDFRKRPIPGVRRRRWGHYYRKIRTHAERREHLGLKADLQDSEDFPVRVKIRGRRRTLPTYWDDIQCSRKGDSWKNYRKTQFKEKR